MYQGSSYFDLILQGLRRWPEREAIVDATGLGLSYAQLEQRIWQVARVLRDAGLKPGEGPREVPDHVALEWEFIHFLTHRHITTGEVDWLEQRDTFIHSHMVQWLPSLAQAMKQA